MNRRGFLTGVAGLLAAPAIVRVSSLMPVSVQPNPMRYLGPSALKAEGVATAFDSYLSSEFQWFVFNDPRKAWLAQRAEAMELFGA